MTDRVSKQVTSAQKLAVLPHKIPLLDTVMGQISTRFRVLWDMMLCRCVSGSRFFKEGHYILYQSQKPLASTTQHHKYSYCLVPGEEVATCLRSIGKHTYATV